MARICVIEDDPLQALNLEEIFISRGHSVCGISASGAQAILCAQASRPDIVVTDVNIAGRLNGVDTAERIVATQQCGVVFVTACSDGKTIARMGALKPEAILSKPSTSQAIIRAVEQAFERLTRTGDR